MKIKPVGTKLLVLPKGRKDFITESGIEVVNNLLAEATVVGVSEFLKDIYKEGDTILYPEKSGNDIPYNGKSHVFLNGQSFPQGDVWAIVTEDE